MSFEGYHVIEKGGAPAKKRFTDAHAVRTVYQHLLEEDLKDAERRAKIKKMFDGNLPYDPQQLRNSGLKNIANINWMGLKAVVKSRASVILRLSSDTANLIEFRPMARELAGPDAERIGRVVAEEFSNTLREGGRFIPVLAAMNQEADLYGLGPVTWVSSMDYLPVALERAQVRFEGDGPVMSSEHEIIMFESVLPAAYIFQLLDNGEVAAEEGWNIAALRDYAVRVFLHGAETAAQPGVAPGSTPVEAQLSLIRRNLFDEEHQFDKFKVIHVFVREMQFPRGITHLILPGSSEDGKFLFEKADAYRRMDDCFVWFPYDVAEKYARSVRGLASDLYASERASNRMKCAFVDIAHRSLTLMFSQAAAGAQAQVTLNEQGPYTFVPKDLVPVPNAGRPDLQQGIMALQYMDSLGVDSVAGTGRWPISSTSPKLFGSDRPTKAEAEIQQRLRTQKDEALFVQRVAVVDKIVRQSFIRFARLVAMVTDPEKPNPVIAADYPEVVDFLRRCQLRQVTPEQIVAIPQMFNIATCRDLVLGADGKVGVLSELLANFGGSIDEPGRRNAVRDWVQLRLGSAAADRYAAEITRDNAPSDQSSFALIENNMIKAGQPVAVGQDQLHWSHIPVHARVLQEIVEQVQAPEDNLAPAASQAMAGSSGANPNANGAENVENPKMLLSVLMAASQHIQEHLAIGGMQIGMQQQAKQVAKMLRDLRPTVKALNLAVATQERVEQAQREKAEREMEELRRQADQAEVEKAKYKVDRDAEVARYRVDQEHEVALRRLELESQRGRAADEAQAGRASAEEARRDAETDARIERESRLANARINASNAVNRFNAVNSVTGQQRVSPADIMLAEAEAGREPEYPGLL